VFEITAGAFLEKTWIGSSPTDSPRLDEMPKISTVTTAVEVGRMLLNR
jgi:hypothetical protein